jgi:hypothetical protein
MGPHDLLEDVAVGREALDPWGDDVARIERCRAGVANEVWSVRVRGKLAVAPARGANSPYWFG